MHGDKGSQPINKDKEWKRWQGSIGLYREEVGTIKSSRHGYG